MLSELKFSELDITSHLDSKGKWKSFLYVETHLEIGAENFVTLEEIFQQVLFQRFNYEYPKYCLSVNLRLANVVLRSVKWDKN